MNFLSLFRLRGLIPQHLQSVGALTVTGILPIRAWGNVRVAEGQYYDEIHVGPASLSIADHGDADPSVVFYAAHEPSNDRAPTLQWLDAQRLVVTYDASRKPHKLASNVGGIRYSIERVAAVELVRDDGETVRDSMVVGGYAAETAGRWEWCKSNSGLQQVRDGEPAPHGPSLWWPSGPVFDARASD